MRRLFCILLMFCLPLQGFAMPWERSLQPSAQSLMHEVLHDEHVSHHHHEDDGSIHIDDSDESSQHIDDHSTSPQPVGLLIPFLVAPPVELVHTVSLDLVEFIPDPMLALPHRPPASALG